MSIQNFSFNPFALNHAKEAWNNQTSSLPVRALKSIGGAGYDIFVQNPYELTIGNCKKWIESDLSLPLTTKIAVVATVVFGSLYTLMLYGSTLYLHGKLTLAIGSATGFEAVIKVGEAIKTSGKYLFLSGAVPIYGIFYAGPKHLIQSLPKIARFVAEKISVVAKWVFHHLLKPIWDNVIVPIAKGIEIAVRFIAKYVSKAINALAEAISTIAQFIFKNILVPFWEKALFPALKAMVKAAQYIGTKIGSALQELGKAVARAALWIFNQILIPLWERGLFPLLKTISKAACFLANQIGSALIQLATTVARAAQWIFAHAIVPAWNTIILPALKLAGQAIVFVANFINASLGIIAKAVSQTAAFAFNQFIVPTFQFIGSLLIATGKFLGNYVIKPLGSLLAYVADKVSLVAQALFQYAIIPAGNAIRAGASAVANGLAEINAEIFNAIYSAWPRFSSVI